MMEKLKSRKLLGLFVLAIALVALPIIIFQTQQSQDIRQRAAGVPTGTGDTKIYLVPTAGNQIVKNTPFTVELKLDTRNKPVANFTVEIIYDSNKYTYTSIRQSTQFNSVLANPNIAASHIRILAEADPNNLINANGITVATLSFTSKAAVGDGIISFADSPLNVVGKNSTGGIISLTAEAPNTTLTVIDSATTVASTPTPTITPENCPGAKAGVTQNLEPNNVNSDPNTGICPSDKPLCNVYRLSSTTYGGGCVAPRSIPSASHCAHRSDVCVTNLACREQGQSRDSSGFAYTLPGVCGLPNSASLTPTKTPTPTPTPNPATATPTPRVTTTATATTVPQATVTPTPQVTGTTAAASPTAANNHPPVPTASANDAILILKLILPGVGRTAAGSNQTPINLKKTSSLAVFNTQNVLVKKVDQDLGFGTGQQTDTEKGYFGNINLGQIGSGSYRIKVKTNNSLWKELPELVLLQGTTTKQYVVVLITGDFNQDNRMNLEDYNIFINCYSGRSSCPQNLKLSSDLNEDGKTDEKDLNVLLRAFDNIEGD